MMQAASGVVTLLGTDLQVDVKLVTTSRRAYEAARAGLDAALGEPRIHREVAGEWAVYGQLTTSPSLSIHYYDMGDHDGHRDRDEAAGERIRVVD